MFKHRYEAGLNPDNPGALVVSIPALDQQTLAQLPQWLIDNISLRFDITGEETHLQARPIVFEIDQEFRISERGIWSMIVEFNNSSTYVTDYLDVAIKTSGEELAWCSSRDQVGQEPIYTYLDRWVQRVARDKNEISEEVYQVIAAFVRFVNSVDMDHEVYQGEYLNMVIQYLWNDADRCAEIIILRLTVGQHRDFFDPINRMLKWHDRLKIIVDRLLREPDVDDQELQYLILKMCAVVYGSHEEATLDVINYCKKIRDYPDEDITKHMKRKLDRFKAIRDIELQFRNVDRTTGFHRYDKTTAHWRAQN